MTQLPRESSDERPAFQITVDCTYKGTAEECEAAGLKLEAAAKRLGFDPPFIEGPERNMG